MDSIDVEAYTGPGTCRECRNKAEYIILLDWMALRLCSDCLDCLLEAGQRAKGEAMPDMLMECESKVRTLLREMSYGREPRNSDIKTLALAFLTLFEEVRECGGSAAERSQDTEPWRRKLDDSA